jgi:VanZ family protein
MEADKTERRKRMKQESGELSAGESTAAPTPPARISTSLAAWAPVIIWSVVLFMLSTSIFSATNTGKIIVPILRWLLPWASATTIDILHSLIRKAAHFTNYAILFWLMIRGPMAGRPYAALGLCVIYALTDEGHQIFATGRGPSWYDVALDSSGALFSRFFRAAIADPL